MRIVPPVGVGHADGLGRQSSRAKARWPRGARRSLRVPGVAAEQVATAGLPRQDAVEGCGGHQGHLCAMNGTLCS